MEEPKGLHLRENITCNSPRIMEWIADVAGPTSVLGTLSSSRYRKKKPSPRRPLSDSISSKYTTLRVSKIQPDQLVICVNAPAGYIF